MADFSESRPIRPVRFGEDAFDFAPRPHSEDAEPTPPTAPADLPEEVGDPKVSSAPASVSSSSSSETQTQESAGAASKPKKQAKSSESGSSEDPSTPVSAEKDSTELKESENSGLPF